MNKQLSPVALLWLPFILLIALTGCKKDTSGNDGATVTIVDPATLNFKYTDNVVRVNLPSEPNSLNPLLTTQAYARYVFELILQPLNAKHPTNLADVPALASLPNVFKRDDGGVDFTYEIHPDAKWPNGLPVTASDVVFTLKVLFNPLVDAGQYRSFYEMIENVTLTPSNEKRFKVETDQPNLLSQAAIGSLAIYPEYAYDPDGLLKNIRLQDLLDFKVADRLKDSNANLKTFADQFNNPAYGRDLDKVIGSGGYQLASWEAGQRIRLEKRADYWAAKSNESWLSAQPDAIEFTFVKEAATLANALRDQEFDAVAEVPIEEYQALEGEADVAQHYTFASTDGFVYYSLFLNQNDPLLADKNTRQALAHLLDLEAIIADNYSGMAKRTVGPILPQKSYYNDALEPYAFNPDRAAELLAAAGWKDTNANGTLDKEIDGQVTELEVKIAAFPTGISQVIALLLQSNAKQVGMNVEVLTQEPRALTENVTKGDYQIATMGAGSDPNPDDLTQVFSSRSVPPNGKNRTGFGNAASDQIIDRIRTTLDDAERHQLYLQIQEIIHHEVPMIFLFAPQGRVMYSKRFKAEASPITPGFRLNDFTQQAWNKPE